MAEFPALPIFTDALLADTSHLTEEEFGAYCRLLILEWRTANFKLPADAAWHARRLGVDQSKYSRLYAPLIDEFFHRDGNYIFQKRLLKEFTYLRQQSEKQSARAKSRWHKEKTACRTHAASGNAPHPTPPKKVATATSPPTPALPDWIPKDQWEAFMEVRKAKGAAQTPRAITALLHRLEGFRTKGHDVTAILDNSIRNSWKDVYEPKEKHNGPRYPEKKSTIDILREGTIAARAARERRGTEPPG